MKRGGGFDPTLTDPPEEADPVCESVVGDDEDGVVCEILL